MYHHGDDNYRQRSGVQTGRWEGSLKFGTRTHLEEWFGHFHEHKRKTEASRGNDMRDLHGEYPTWLNAITHPSPSSARTVSATSIPRRAANASPRTADPTCTCTDPQSADGCHDVAPRTPVNWTCKSSNVWLKCSTLELDRRLIYMLPFVTCECLITEVMDHRHLILMAVSRGNTKWIENSRIRIPPNKNYKWGVPAVSYWDLILPTLFRDFCTFNWFDNLRA